MNRERNKPTAQQLTMQRLATVLKQEGLSLAVWDDLKDVAAASNSASHHGKGVAPVLMLHMVQTGKLMSPDLAPQQQSVKQVLLYLHTHGYR